MHRGCFVPLRKFSFQYQSLFYALVKYTRCTLYIPLHFAHKCPSRVPEINCRSDGKLHEVNARVADLKNYTLGFRNMIFGRGGRAVGRYTLFFIASISVVIWLLVNSFYYRLQTKMITVLQIVAILSFIFCSRIC